MPFLKRINKLYDAVIEVNPSQKKWMEEYGVNKEKVLLIPNGLSKETFKKFNISDKKRIIKGHGLENKFIISYLGRIQRYKGLDQVIKTLPNLKKANKEILFLAMGRDVGDKKFLIGLAKSLGVSQNVKFTGEVNDKEKLILLDKSEIFVFPSEWEAFGIAMLEAMARKNAIISTKTEGGKFLMGKNNWFLYDFGNVKDLENKLSKIIKNKQLRKEMQLKNYHRSKKFLWVKILKDLEESYTRLLRKK